MLKLHLSEEERVIFASNLVASKKRFTKMEKGRFGNFLDNAKIISHIINPCLYDVEDATGYFLYSFTLNDERPK
ncbi:hypothetical protein AtNW77_Chr2g0266041 [Arabidopsis thaliana]|uniref:Uncharacterized protein At2g43450 n=1 Tax=Arabidopsis thaliana TaxID=3702 RepID=O22859_ARATH|nr:uncharacterized protein AT2G43450 [Arabidopsis thaliana]AAB64316.1 hypothetical protein [Arabidopsis thaliana]AEC10271.1 hypothetical protein AT2G43450 [Arabidopsis thaliana]|eukprot:NP_181873.1 hypothetical protein AT2G43450 [Arabidopsis thaliana]